MLHDGSIMTKALLIRMDRIGDLVLTLPTDQALAQAEVEWWIPKGLSFVTDSASPKRSAREVGKEIGFQEFCKLVRDIRAQRYTLAVVFQAPWWVGLALFLARVPTRIGVRSKLPSFLFFNRGVRQKRSRSDRSELEYNFNLLEEGLRKPLGSLPRSTLQLAAPFPLEVLTRVLPPNAEALASHNYYVIHPGMGGSALNWPTEKYAELARELSKLRPVVVTGTKADEAYL
ncbi:MAG: lipopolysaccharide heptosyltransferase family protein, partial [Proteobacteria bacterium]